MLSVEVMVDVVPTAEPITLPIFVETVDESASSSATWLAPFASTTPSVPSTTSRTSAADTPPTAAPPNATATSALRATRDDPFDFERAVSSAATHVPVVAFQTVR
ncbi:hypothetical protein JM78_13185 [Burkholderia pyrrocinia]|nr:hypothetical protein JM78_13185 [Burkholderia pyrrocinia]